MGYEVISGYAPQGATEPTTVAGKAKGWLTAIGLMGFAVLVLKYGPKFDKPRKRKNPSKKRKNPRRRRAVAKRRPSKMVRRKSPRISKAKRRAAALKGWRRRK